MNMPEPTFLWIPVVSLSLGPSAGCLEKRQSPFPYAEGLRKICAYIAIGTISTPRGQEGTLGCNVPLLNATFRQFHYSCVAGPSVVQSPRLFFRTGVPFPV